MIPTVAFWKPLDDIASRMWNPSKTLEMIEKRGRTRKWVADKCGIEVKSLNNILRGKTPGKPVLILLAQALETPVDELVKNENAIVAT